MKPSLPSLPLLSLVIVCVTQASAGPGTRSQPVEEMSPLEARIETYIKGLRHKGVIPSLERTSWSVYDFTTDRKLVTINEDTPRQAASMIKPFVALSFFHRVKMDELIYGSKSKSKMKGMLQCSDNSDTNWIMKHAGGPSGVQRILKTHYGHIFKETQVTEYIPSGGRTYRNKASAHDYSRFLYALWNDQIPYSTEIKRLMALPNKDRCYWGASHIPKGTLVYDKTGSTAMLCGQIAILVPLGRDGNRYPYTFIAIIERDKRTRHFGSWVSHRANVLREVSNMVYDEINRMHHLR